jgi:hypothetical protein
MDSNQFDVINWCISFFISNQSITSLFKVRQLRLLNITTFNWEFEQRQTPTPTPSFELQVLSCDFPLPLQVIHLKKISAGRRCFLKVLKRRKALDILCVLNALHKIK